MLVYLARALIFLLITLSDFECYSYCLHKCCPEISDKSIVKMIKKKPQRTSKRMITLINITNTILSTDEHGIISHYNSAARRWLTGAEPNGSLISRVLNKRLNKADGIWNSPSLPGFASATTLWKSKMAIIFAWSYAAPRQRQARLDMYLSCAISRVSLERPWWRRSVN